MTDKDNLNEIQKLIKTIQSDTSMYPAKQKAIICHMENVKESILKSEEDYIKKEQITAIANKLTIIFVPLFLIFMIIYSYGIPNYILRETNIFFLISITSFAIAMASTAIAAGLHWMQQKIFSPKSA